LLGRTTILHRTSLPLTWKVYTKTAEYYANLFIFNFNLKCASVRSKTTPLANQQLEVAAVLLAVAVLLSLVVVILAVELEAEGVVRGV
jgi:hypothetical protein